ncbi:pyridoxamine 5-phosphate oxidase [Rhodococcus oxybenzonivorans]|uniref:Pyridoxamine 5-phosphate oxidase n=2 Tax=Rhodococcus oxybenzonivorans TaxID=1990687 RepID=A0A2S2C3N3_9NOCA|nr:pyridoxamine 5-phosphate oxidase [Rhodococcus oxybenzonivorans]
MVGIMTRYVALLRGINVGGINIKMAELRRTFSDLGFENVKTVLASGNVLFDSDRTDTAGLKGEIEKALSAEFHYEAWVFVLDLDTVRKIVDDYPFDPEREGWHPYVLVTPDPDILSGFVAKREELDPAVERIQAGNGVLYWEVERGMTLKSTFGKSTGTPRLKASTTTRNLRTLQKLLK